MLPTAAQIAELFALHNSPERRRELLLRSYGFDDTRSWIDPNGYRLSDRIWRARAAVRSQIDAVLRKAIAEGTDALEVADILEQYLNPELAPVRNALGRLIRNQRKSIVTRSPGRGGMGSAFARTLARTEITRAHGAATIRVAEQTPFAKGVKWSTSTSHPKADLCDEHARRNAHKLGPGVYPPSQVPRYPEHPACLCTLSTVTEDDIDSVVDRLREQYDLGEVTSLPFDEQVSAHADKLFQRAQAAEPAVTQAMQRLARETNADLAGLQHRLKTLESTGRKIANDARNLGLPLETVADRVYDNLRYTFRLNAAEYENGVRTVTQSLIDQGYQPYRVKNFWANQDGYSGINMIMKTEQGQYFEVQFHTDASLYTKEAISHPLYEAMRELEPGDIRVEDYKKQISDAWKSVREETPISDLPWLRELFP